MAVPDTVIESMFSITDLDEIKSAIDSQFKPNWIHVANCVHHEMYPKLSSAICSIIKQENKHFDVHNLEDQAIENMLKCLKKQRNLGIDEGNYLYHLVIRTRSFTPITKQNKGKNSMCSSTIFRSFALLCVHIYNQSNMRMNKISMIPMKMLTV